MDKSSIGHCVHYGPHQTEVKSQLAEEETQQSIIAEGIARLRKDMQAQGKGETAAQIKENAAKLGL